MITINSDEEKTRIDLHGKTSDLISEANDINVCLICNILRTLTQKDGVTDLELKQVTKEILQQYTAQFYKCACMKLDLKE